jgi:hypothetical protein
MQHGCLAGFVWIPGNPGVSVMSIRIAAIEVYIHTYMAKFCKPIFGSSAPD